MSDEDLKKAWLKYREMIAGGCVIGAFGVYMWLQQMKQDLENKTLSFGEFKKDLLKNNRVSHINVTRKLDSYN
jgi:hypothetical protein